MTEYQAKQNICFLKFSEYLTMQNKRQSCGLFLMKIPSDFHDCSVRFLKECFYKYEKKLLNK